MGAGSGKSQEANAGLPVRADVPGSACHPIDKAGCTRDRVWDIGIISVVWTLAAVLCNPFADTPFIDDWVYAWSVEHLLRYGQLRFLDYCGNANPVQILWGALFCVPGGFSFAALRLATCLSALICLIFVYLLMRELGTTRQRALLAIGVIGFNPIFYILAFSFMTDTPLLAMMAGAFWMFMRAMRRQSTVWLVGATAMCAGGCGVRLSGAIMPIAMSIVLLLHTGPWGRRRCRWVLPLTSLVFLVLVLQFAGSHTVAVGDPYGMNNSPASRKMLLRYALPLLPSSIPTATLLMGWCVGLALLPVSSAAINRKALMWGLPTAAVLLGLALFFGQGHAAPLSPRLTWSIGELGATAPLIPGYVDATYPAWLYWMLRAVACCSLAGAIWVLRPHKGAGEMVFVWSIVGHLAMMSILWLFYDRYVLPVALIAVAWFVVRAPRIRLPLAWLLTFVMTIYTLLAVRDHLALNRALWDAEAYARETLHLPEVQVDGGYVVNGWRLYAHSERATHDERGLAVVPGVNSKELTRYQISLSPPSEAQARVLAEFPYRRLLGTSGKLYLFERN